jgi:hypothetical protein
LHTGCQKLGNDNSVEKEDICKQNKDTKKIVKYEKMFYFFAKEKKLSVAMIHENRGSHTFYKNIGCPYRTA